MLPILACAKGRKGGRGRKGKSSSLLSLSDLSLMGLGPSTPCRYVPLQTGGGGGGGVCFLRRFGLRTGINFAPILV